MFTEKRFSGLFAKKQEKKPLHAVKVFGELEYKVWQHEYSKHRT
jgi:hypothetical protein